MEYFFGKVTMYTSFNIEARDMILFFMRKYFKDNERLVEPIVPLEIHINDRKLGSILCGNSYEEDYKILSRYVREHGENIPPHRERLHEFVPLHEVIRNRYQSGIRWCGRNGNLNQNSRCLRHEKSTSYFNIHPSHITLEEVLIPRSRRSG